MAMGWLVDLALTPYGYTFYGNIEPFSGRFSALTVIKVGYVRYCLAIRSGVGD